MGKEGVELAQQLWELKLPCHPSAICAFNAVQLTCLFVSSVCNMWFVSSSSSRQFFNVCKLYCVVCQHRAGSACCLLQAVLGAAGLTRHGSRCTQQRQHRPLLYTCALLIMLMVVPIL